MPDIDAKKIEELLPCPFCGAGASLRTSPGAADIHCDGCDSAGPYCGDAQSAIVAWNRRASYSVTSASGEDGPHEVKLPPGWLARDVAAAAARLEPKVGDADEITSDATASESEAAALRERVGVLEKALEPFARYFDWARRHEWPATIAEDDMTPVAGREDPTGETETLALYVGNFRRARTALEGRDDG